MTYEENDKFLNAKYVEEIMSSRIQKSPREWAAAKEIKKLRELVTDLTAEVLHTSERLNEADWKIYELERY